jgi:DNA-binding response OmpR family regulator
MRTILLVEDNLHILKTNRAMLEKADYRVLCAKTAAETRALLHSEMPDLMVLDIMLPDGDGVALCQELRAPGSAARALPILFLTALGEKDEIVTGLRAGGDDYLPKPYDYDEFLARIEVLLRRIGRDLKEETPLCFGELEINFTARRVRLHGADLLLKPKEFALLELLARNRDKYLAAEELYEKLWGMDAAGNICTVHAHIYNLRRKLEDSRVVLELKRGNGYRLTYDASARN